MIQSNPEFVLTEHPNADAHTRPSIYLQIGVIVSMFLIDSEWGGRRRLLLVRTWSTNLDSVYKGVVVLVCVEGVK